MDDPDFEEQLAQSALDAADEFAELSRAEETAVTDDGSAALAAETEQIELLIPTGREDTEGRPVKVRVKVIDPRTPEVALAVLHAQAFGPKAREQATLELWRACVVSPANILEEPNFQRTTTAFRTSLTYKLLRILGVDGSFFEDLEAMVPPKALRAARRFSSESPARGASRPAKSASGSAPASSGKPTSTSPKSAPESASKP